MAAPGLAAQLEALLQQLAGGGETEESALAMRVEAGRLNTSAVAWRKADHSEYVAAELRSIVQGSAVRLEPALTALQQRLRSQGEEARAAGQHSLDAACSAMAACMSLAPKCGVSSTARQQLAQAAAVCLVHSGRMQLARDAAGAGNTEGTAALTLKARLQQQLQLAALCIRVPGLSAEAAAKAAPPAQLAKWMAAAADALRRLGDNRQTAHLQRELLPTLVDTCHALCCTRAWQAHATAVLQPPLSERLAGLCLTLLGVLAVSLPLPPERRPAGCTWRSPYQLARLLLGGDGPLHPALMSHIRAADSSSISAAVVAAAQLVQQVPLDQPPPGFSKEHPHLLLAVANLLANLAVLAGKDLSVFLRLGSQQQRRMTQQVLQAVSQLPQQLQLATGGRQAAEFGDEQQMLVFGMVSAAHCTMLLLYTFCQYAPPNSGSSGLPVSAADAAAWCSAACGALQCMPTVQQLHGMRQLQAGPARGSPAAQRSVAREHSKTPAFFCHVARQLAKYAATYAVAASKHATSAPVGTAAAAAIAGFTATWQLHSRLAQLVHFSAAADSPLVSLGNPDDAESLLQPLTDCVCAAAALQREGQASASPAAEATTRQLQGVCSAHIAAVLVCDASCPIVRRTSDLLSLRTMLAGLAVAIGEAPLAAGLDPALHRLFGSLWSKIGADHQSTRQSIWSLVLGTALLGRPCLAALLASGDCLNAVVQTAGQDAALMEMLHGVLRKLQTAAACAIAAAAEAADISGSNGAEDEAAALDSVRQASANFEAAMSQRDIAVHGVRGVLLPPARRLAAALLDWWRRPAAQQEQQLEAAQATAARSCAYLRCANLGAGGGPAAGQSEGSLRCSACRAAWYCGTACSHADWRAGHKRVCKALGAARAAEKAARRAVAGAAAAANAAAAGEPPA